MDGYTYNKNSVLEKYDQEPTEYSHNLVNSGNIQKYVDAADALVDAKVDQMIARVGNPFVFKGTKATTSALPSSGNTVNDTWFVTETGFMYTWNGTSWDQTSTDVNNQLSKDIATAYSETKADYKHGDLVLYNNQVYMRKNDATQADGAFVSSNWTAISIGDRVRTLQSDVEGLFASPFDSTQSYNKGDYVIYNDNFYRAKTDISADTAWIATNWEQVTVDTELHRRDEDITDLKSALITDLDANININPGFEQGFWYSSSSTTRRDYVRTIGGIPCTANDVFTVNMLDHDGTEVQFNYYLGDTYVSRTVIKKKSFIHE